MASMLKTRLHNKTKPIFEQTSASSAEKDGKEKRGGRETDERGLEWCRAQTQDNTDNPKES